MRKSNVAGVFFMGLIVLSGCSSLKNMVKLAEMQQIDVVPSPLELHGDSVKVEMSVVLPAKILPQKYKYNLASYFKYGEQQVTVGTMAFDAVDFPNSSTSTSRKSASYAFLYMPEMSQGIYQIEGIAIDQGGETLATRRFDNAQGIITTSQLVEDVFYSAYADNGYNDQEELISTNVELYFPQGSSVLARSEIKSSNGKEFTAFIAAKNVTKTVTITGTHSPEGTETINSSLSGDRVAAIEKYYRTQMKKYDYMDMSAEINFILKPVVEDWTAFKNALNTYEDATDTQKSEILAIVNGVGTFEDKEKSLQRLSSYKGIFKTIYPKLRAAKTDVLTVKEKKTNAEIAILAQQIAENTISVDTLSSAELLFAATLTPSVTEKVAIYKVATKKDGSWKAHNNLGAAYLELAIATTGDGRKLNIEMALTQLEIAANKNSNADVLANQATAYLMQGNKAQAYDAAVAALAQNPSSAKVAGINGVKGAIEIKNGNYDDAFTSMTTANETDKIAFNRGLALLLNKDYENAITGFGNAIEKNDKFAKAYYASAIASARLNNVMDVVESLKKAVGLDAELKAKALKDLEFMNYATQVSAALN